MREALPFVDVSGEELEVDSMLKLIRWSDLGRHAYAVWPVHTRGIHL